MSGEHAPPEIPPACQAAESANPTLATSESDDDGDRKHFTIPQTVFDNLLLAGFSENAIKKAIVAGCIDEGTCTQWIKMHEGHPELDTALADGVEVTVKAKRVLTESEREEKVRELQEKIRQRKEEEKAEAANRERERIAMGRKALETKEHLDAVRRQAELEEVRRQKAADTAARRKIKIQIIADRYVRQGKNNEEAWQLAEQEWGENAERLRQAAAARAQESHNEISASSTTVAEQASPGAAWSLAAVVDTAGDSIQAIFNEPLQGANSDVAALAAALNALPDSPKKTQCLETLRIIVGNILTFPLDIKKRTLRTSTKAFTQNLRPFEPALRLLHLCNFDLITDTEGNQNITCSTVVIWKLQRVLSCLQA